MSNVSVGFIYMRDDLQVGKCCNTMIFHHISTVASILHRPLTGKGIGDKQLIQEHFAKI